ncbi:MAG: MATE family efflux transporter, partial [Pseudomonadota bacterium]
VLIALCAGLTMATSILISQHYGAKDFIQLRKVVDSSTILIAVVSVGLLIMGEFMAGPILKAMDTPPDVLPLSIGYLRISFWGLPFGFGLFLIRSMLQGIGDSKSALYFQGLSLLLNAVLDPLLMFGLLGLPKLGLNGTAWATIIAQSLMLFCLWFYLKKKQSLVAPSFTQFQFDWPTTWTTIRIGIPSAIQQSLVSIGMIFITSIVNGFGETVTAAFGAASRIDQIAFMPAMTFSMAISTMTGQNIGAQKFHRIKEIFYWGCLMSGCITAMASLLAVSMPHFLLSIFINRPEVISEGVSYLHIVGSCYLFFAIMFVSNGIISGAGHTFMTTIISLISLWIVRVPFATYFSHHLGQSKGIWYAISLSYLVAMATSLSYYFSGRWKKAIGRRRGVPPTPPEPEIL